MFVFDKRLSPEQAINFKPANKSPFGYLTNLVLGGVSAPVLDIQCTDPTAAAGTGGADASGGVQAVALLTRVRWDLGATDPIIIQGMFTMANKQQFVALLYAGLNDISLDFAIKVFEYDPVIPTKQYYACFSATCTGKLLKDGDRELAIELSDEEELSIQDNSFYSFSMKVVPTGPAQIITLAAATGSFITKKWGRTTSA
jgi:hypothetical protein